MRKTEIGRNCSVIGDDILATIGPIALEHPGTTFAVTPASLIALEAIEKNRHLLHGTGIDWGCGSGCLSIALAKIKNVKSVIGLDIMEDNIEISKKNALANGVADKTGFIRSDSFMPFGNEDKKTIAGLMEETGFIVSNPPSSERDDGFDFRRRILREAAGFLVKGGVVFLNISSQYGRRRIEELTEKINGFTRAGLLATTEWVEFDLRRKDLLACLHNYTKEEKRGGWQYEFTDPRDPRQTINAIAALSIHEDLGLSPLSQWQTHLFVKR